MDPWEVLLSSSVESNRLTTWDDSKQSWLFTTWPFLTFTCEAFISLVILLILHRLKDLVKWWTLRAHNSLVQTRWENLTYKEIKILFSLIIFSLEKTSVLRICGVMEEKSQDITKSLSWSFHGQDQSLQVKLIIDINGALMLLQKAHYNQATGPCMSIITSC